jgi:hypothetical protein
VELIVSSSVRPLCAKKVDSARDVLTNALYV